MNNPRLNLRAFVLCCAALGVSFIGGCASEETQDGTNQPKAIETSAAQNTKAEEWSFQLLDGSVLTPFKETGTFRACDPVDYISLDNVRHSLTYGLSSRQKKADLN